jgi:putative acetyltransferase
MFIRDETGHDADAVYTLVSSAFGRTAEAQLVRDLHAAGEVVVALVAEDEGEVIGHVLLSRLAAPFPALALAPVSVSPGRQRTGIGSALVREALRRASDDHWRAVFVLGDPKYYGRFGFSAAAAVGFSSPYAGDYFMGLALSGAMPEARGELRHARAFSALS